MKKYLFFLFTLFSVYGCTLSMEEYELPEEETLGFDEPNTITTDVGSLTYQFNDSVIYVDEQVQNYLIQAEHDSILYFMNNIPASIRPYVGVKLASGCTRKLPMGLNHQVLSVEDVGGMLKVVCTAVTAEEVYKELSYCVDADMGYADFSQLDDETLESMGYQRHDSIIIDWGLHDSIMGINEEQREVRRMAMRRTRSAEDEMESVETGSDKIHKNEFINWYFDSRNIGKLFGGLGQAWTYFNDYGDAIENQLANQRKKHPFLENLYAGFAINITHYQRAHAEKDERKKYELNYTDTWTEGKLRVEVGAELKKTPKSELSQDKIGKMTVGHSPEWLRGAHDWVTLSNSMGPHVIDANLVPEKDRNKSWGTPKLRVVLPTGPVPLAFIAEAKINPEIGIKGCIAASATFTTETRRTGYEIKHGKRRNINEKVADGTFHFDNVALNGSFKVGANFRASCGLELAGTFAATVGANLDCFFEAEGSLVFGADPIDNPDNPEDVSSEICQPKGSAHFWVDFYGDVKLHVAPLGMELWDKQVAKFLTVHLIDLNTKMEPNIYLNSGQCVANENKLNAKGFFQLKEANGVRCFTIATDYYPAMLMYLGPVKNKKFVRMKLNPDMHNSEKPVEPGKTYYFVYEGEKDVDENEVFFRPCLYAPNALPGTPQYIFADDNQVAKCEIGSPDISTVAALQVMGMPSFDYTYFDDGTKSYVDMQNGEYGNGMSIDFSKVNLRQYKFMTVLNVVNGSRMSKWGVKVKIYNPAGKCCMRRKVPINKSKSGRYTLTFSFLTDWEEKTSGGKMKILMQPYWEDINGGAKFEASDNNSQKMWPIEYEFVDENGDYKDLSLKNLKTDDYFGNIQPEIDLE